MTGGSWPLVGRSRELELIAGTMERARHGGVLIAGAPGSGRSRLAGEVFTAARERGWVTREAVATAAASSIPFGALAHLLPGHASGPTSPLAVLRQAGAALRQQARGGRLALLVDDAHHLDDSSAALVHQLATTRSAFVLLTVRDGERCSATLQALWKDGIALRLGCRPLGPVAVAGLVAEALGGEVDGRTLHELVRLAGGNLVHLRELLRTGLDSGALEAQGSVWRWSGPMLPDGGLRVLIEGRLPDAGTPARRLLEMVALAEPVGPRLLRGFGPEELAAECEATGLLRASRDGARTQVTVADPLVAAVVRAGTGALAARELQRRLAELARATGARRRDDALRIAAWRLEAGERPGAEPLTGAAARALETGDYGLAERLSRAAAGAGGGAGSSVLLAQALMAQGHPDQAEEVLAAIPGDGGGAARTVFNRALNLSWSLGRIAEAEAVIGGAGEEDPDDLPELCAARAVSLFGLGRPAEAVAQAARVLERSEQPGPPALLALALTGAAQALMGRGEDSLACVDRALDARRAMPDTHPVAEHHLRLVEWMTLALAGRLHDAGEVARAGYEAALRHGDEHARAQWCYQLGAGALWTGRVRTATGWLEQAVTLCRENDAARVLALALAALAEAAAIAGDVDRAAAALDAVTASLPHERAWLLLGHAWVTALRGDRPEARATALHAADVAAGQGFVAIEAMALHAVARLGDPAAVSARLQALVPRVQGHAIPLMAAHTVSLAAGDGTALAAAAGGFERQGALLVAAEAWAAASRVHRRAGQALRAGAADMHAQDLAGRCEGAHTPGLEGDGAGAALTVREQEVARLAATGLSSREIAARLGVSVRTVDNHLQSVYSKLSVHGRRELVDVLVPRGEAGPG